MSVYPDANTTPCRTVAWQEPILSGAQPGKRRRETPLERRHTAEEWDRRRDRITELFETMDLTEVAIIMAQEGFDASISQYRHRLKNWGHWKYLTLTKKQWTYIGQSLVEREETGKETAFRWNGKNIPSWKLDKGLTEKLEEGIIDLTLLRATLRTTGSSEGLSAYTAPTGEGITITTTSKSVSQLRHVRSGISSHGSLSPLPEDRTDNEPSQPPLFLLRRFFGVPSRQNSVNRDSRPQNNNLTEVDIQEYLELAKARVEAAEKERDDLWQQLDRLKYAAEAEGGMQEQLNLAKATAETTSKESGELQQKLAAQIGENQRLRLAYADVQKNAKTRLEEVEEEMQGLQKHLASLTKKYRRLKEKGDLPQGLSGLSELCRRFRSRTSNTGSAKARVKALEKERDALREEILSLTKTTHALSQARNLDLQQARAEWEAAQRLKDDALRKKYNTLKSDLEKEELRSVRAERRLKNIQNDHEVVINELENRQSKFDEMANLNALLNSVLEERTASLRAREQTIKELQDEIEPLRRYKKRRSGPRAPTDRSSVHNRPVELPYQPLQHRCPNTPRVYTNGDREILGENEPCQGGTATVEPKAIMAYTPSRGTTHMSHSAHNISLYNDGSSLRERFQAQVSEQSGNSTELLTQTTKLVDIAHMSGEAGNDHVSLSDWLEDGLWRS